MNRRQFIAFLGGAALAGPIDAGAQPPRMPTIGFISSASPNGFAFYTTAFRNGLKATGYFEGWNVAVEYRWAERQFDRLPALAADLVKRNVGAIFADAKAALAAKSVTRAIPIVFSSAGDPVQLGLVSNLIRPGGNITGVSVPSSANSLKTLQLLRALLPAATVVGYLRDPDESHAARRTGEVEAAAQAFGLKFHAVDARGASDYEKAFATFVQQQVNAVIVGGDPRFIGVRDQIIDLAARRAIPAIYNLRPWAVSGGLMSFGPSIEDANRQCGVYVARVLKGASAADLPVVQANKIELVINLKTAKTLGLTVPQPLILAADELIE